MFAMFKQIFATITMFFSAIHQLAEAGNKLAGVANDKATAFAAEAKLEDETIMRKLIEQSKE